MSFGFSNYLTLFKELSEALKIVNKGGDERKKILDYEQEMENKKIPFGKVKGFDVEASGHILLPRELEKFKNIDDLKKQMPRIGHLTNQRIIDILNKALPQDDGEYLAMFKEQGKYNTLAFRVKGNQVMIKTIILGFKQNPSYGVNNNQTKLVIENREFRIILVD